MDRNFGSSGSVLTRVGTVSEDHANAVALQPDGKILVTGYSHTRYAGDFTVLRYKNSGRLDKSFASSGTLVNQLMNSYGSTGTSLAVQRDGHILVGGSFVKEKHYKNNELIVARLTPSGDFDDSFGDQGLVRLFSGKWGSKGSSIAVQGDGKILVSGRSRGQGSFILTRLLSNGQPDISFANKGYVQFDFSEGDIYPKNIKLLKNGEILVSGLITYRACLAKKAIGALFLLRLTADGKLNYLPNG
ncbi:MAG: hypothetical protein KAJ03_09210 [Gammaproteobacteria bacterium]|nr:hypothetical protein [Gammaproteobacteria bacterium]